MTADAHRAATDVQAAHVTVAERDDARDVAVIGMAGRFPRGPTVAEFWQNVRNGVECITFFSDEELIAAGIDAALVRDPRYVKAAPLLEGADLFDAALFGYTPREAETIDPQQRVFLECAWEALEHAGCDPHQYGGAIGVFGGSALNTYLLFSGLLPRLTSDYALTLTGSDKDYLTTRVSYKLDLHGPSLAVQTACSTSLVAVHLACQSLLTRDCDIALAGGVSVRVPLVSGYLYGEGSMVSPDGHCRAFAADARGTIFGSGAGIVVLKRLADAVADRDCIHAVIKGSAINNDGGRKVSYTAPSVERQAAAAAEALAAAGIDAGTIDYVEAHGAGTELGDPIEIEALTRAFRLSTTRCGYCAIGSVKTNIGHLDAAAGVAGLIKTVLSLERGEIPPSLNCLQTNPAITFDATPFYVNRVLRPWPETSRPRRASVNSLGVGGTNAHVVVEEAPQPQASGPSRPVQLLVASAATPTALAAMTTTLAGAVAHAGPVELADMAYTAAIGRRALTHRRFVVCRNGADAAEALTRADANRVYSARVTGASRDIVFMFTGQGVQRADMARELYASEPRFREHVDRCSEIVAPDLGADVRDSLYASLSGAAATGLDDPAVAQTALFTVEYSLAMLWMSYGLRPAALMGHSVGEVVAACVSGVFSLEDGLRLIAGRGALVREIERGAMLAVSLPPAEVEALLDADLSLAAINGSRLCVVSGPVPAIDTFERRLTAAAIIVSRLATQHAFHSAMMEPIVERLIALAAGLERRPPSIPLISTVTGDWLSPEEAVDPAHWGNHLRATVRFADGLTTALESTNRTLLEVGPGRTLARLAGGHQKKTGSHLVFASLPQDGTNELEFFLTTAGHLWLSGTEIDWTAFYAREQRRRVVLPTYRFDRQRYWLTPMGHAAVAQAATSAPRAVSDGTEEIASGGDPSTPTQDVIAAIWREVMGLADVGPHENFFDLGGHSLLIPPIVSRINRAFQIDLELLTVVGAPTVAGLAACVENVRRMDQDDGPLE